MVLHEGVHVQVRRSAGHPHHEVELGIEGVQFVGPFAELPLVKQLRAVVRQDDDHGIVHKVQIRHRVQQTAHVLVHKGDLPEVQRLDAPEF